LKLKSLNLSLIYSDLEFFFKSVLEMDVAEMHEEMIKVITKNHRVVIQAPRGHGKSELAAVAYSLWLLFRAEFDSKKIDILIVSSTQDQSTKILERIKYYIETTFLLRSNLFPEHLHESKWAGTEFATKNASRVISRPLAPSIRGLHTEYVICDDILRDEIGSTEKTKKLFHEVVLPVADKGQMVVVGTPQSYIDLLQDLSNKEINPNWASLKFQAVILDASGNWMKPAFPERFTLDYLKEIKSNVGTVAWSKEYMCEPVSGGSSLFPWELIHPCIDNALVSVESGKKSKEYFGGMDVAVSDKEGADRTVFALGEQGNIKEPLKVVKLEVRQGWSTDRTFQRGLDLQKNFQFKHFLVEQVGVSYDLAREFMQHAATRTSFE